MAQYLSSVYLLDNFDPGSADEAMARDMDALMDWRGTRAAMGRPQPAGSGLPARRLAMGGQAATKEQPSPRALAITVKPPMCRVPLELRQLGQAGVDWKVAEHRLANAERMRALEEKNQRLKQQAAEMSLRKGGK